MIIIGKTDVGKRRSNNEDSFFAGKLCENAVFGVVCDGMGGAQGGDVASEIALDIFTSTFKEGLSPYIDTESGRLVPDATLDIEKLLAESCAKANTAVYTRSLETPELAGMGTTLVAAFVCDGKLYISNVGDSRLYKLADGECVLLTHDHSYVQCLIDVGAITPEEAAVHPKRNAIVRAVGIGAEESSDTFEYDLTAGDTAATDTVDENSVIVVSDEAEYQPCYLMLCSDGLIDEVTEEEIAEIVFASADGEESEETLALKAQQLISLANDYGGRDNTTVVLIKV